MLKFFKNNYATAILAVVLLFFLIYPFFISSTTFKLQENQLMRFKLFSGSYLILFFLIILTVFYYKNIVEITVSFFTKFANVFKLNNPDYINQLNKENTYVGKKELNYGSIIILFFLILCIVSNILYKKFGIYVFSYMSPTILFLFFVMHFFFFVKDFKTTRKDIEERYKFYKLKDDKSFYKNIPYTFYKLKEVYLNSNPYFIGDGLLGAKKAIIDFLNKKENDPFIVKYLSLYVFLLDLTYRRKFKKKPWCFFYFIIFFFISCFVIKWSLYTFDWIAILLFPKYRHLFLIPTLIGVVYAPITNLEMEYLSVECFGLGPVAHFFIFFYGVFALFFLILLIFVIFSVILYKLVRLLFYRNNPRKKRRQKLLGKLGTNFYIFFEVPLKKFKFEEKYPLYKAVFSVFVVFFKFTIFFLKCFLSLSFIIFSVSFTMLKHVFFNMCLLMLSILVIYFFCLISPIIFGDKYLNAFNAIIMGFKPYVFDMAVRSTNFLLKNNIIFSHFMESKVFVRFYDTTILLGKIPVVAPELDEMLRSIPVHMECFFSFFHTNKFELDIVSNLFLLYVVFIFASYTYSFLLFVFTFMLFIFLMALFVSNTNLVYAFFCFLTISILYILLFFISNYIIKKLKIIKPKIRAYFINFFFKKKP